MQTTLIAIILGIGLTIVTVAADVLIKKASLANLVFSWQMLAAFIIYGLTTLGWFFLLQKFKLSSLAALYGICNILFLTIISALYFKERIYPLEIFGIILALISLIILARFA